MGKHTDKHSHDTFRISSSFSAELHNHQVYFFYFIFYFIFLYVLVFLQQALHTKVSRVLAAVASGSHPFYIP